jgi:hypothetical protein
MADAIRMSKDAEFRHLQGSVSALFSSIPSNKVELRIRRLGVRISQGALHFFLQMYVDVTP